MDAEKGKLSISIKADNSYTVIFRPVNNTVWINRNELCELFGIYIHQLNTCLNDLFKTNMLHLDEVCKYHRFVKNNKICYDITEVNLKVIIIIAFRLESSNAGILREWFINRMLKSDSMDFPLEDKWQYSLN